MTWWAAPCGGTVYVPSSLRGLPAYKRDAWRLFMAGASTAIVRALS